MGPQYQATIDSYAASPQATQSAGNQTLGKAIEQSPVHSGFGTGSSMYDNDMDKSYQPAPVATPPQPQNQPASAGINPSWSQQSRKRGGRAKRADGGMLATTAPAQNPMLTSSAPRTFGQQAAGLTAFNLPGEAQGFAQVPLSEFGSMYNQPGSMMMTGDTAARFNFMPSSINALRDVKTLPQNLLNQSAQAAGIDTSVAADQSRAGNYIDRIYQDYLGRSPDTAGRQYYMSQLQSGKMTPDQIQSDFLGSPEYQAQLASSLASGQSGVGSKVANYVDNMYRSYLGRAPDVEGRQYYINQIMSGAMSPDRVRTDILGSKENTARSAAGVPNQQDILSGVAGTGYTPAVGEIGNYVDQLYNKYLGRAPDEAGRQYYADQLLSGRMTPEQVQRDVLGSREFGANLSATIPPMMPSQAPPTGIIPDQPGTVDPFVNLYNARTNAAQNIYGGIAQQNYTAAQEQQKQYEADLAALQKTAQDKLAEAEIAKQQQDAEAARRAAAEAAYQQQLLLLMMMSQR